MNEEKIVECIHNMNVIVGNALSSKRTLINTLINEYGWGWKEIAKVDKINAVSLFRQRFPNMPFKKAKEYVELYIEHHCG